MECEDRNKLREDEMFVPKELNIASVFIGVHVWLKPAVDCVAPVVVPVDAHSAAVVFSWNWESGMA